MTGQEKSVKSKLGLFKEQQEGECLGQVNEAMDGTNENEGVDLTAPGKL